MTAITRPRRKIDEVARARALGHDGVTLPAGSAVTIATTKSFRFLDAGDGGLMVEFGETIDEATNRAVVALADALDARSISGLIEAVPTYRSLLLLFDPVTLPRKRLVEIVEACWPPPEGGETRGTLWHVPVRYGGEQGVDLRFVADARGLDEEAVVALHTQAEYRVYMIGFAPGFAYLGGLPEALHTSRRQDPRPVVPPRSISIGGQQAAVGPPLAIPSGWHLLGQTPVRSYDPARTARPFLFSPGDAIRFEPVGASDYDALCAAADAGDLIARGAPRPARETPRD